MTGEERGQWVSVARLSLTGIPADLLERGCAKARLTCRFPSEIVPAIMAEVGPEWERRKRHWRETSAAMTRDQTPRLPRAEQVKPEEAAAILASHGLPSIIAGTDWVEQSAA